MSILLITILTYIKLPSLPEENEAELLITQSAEEPKVAAKGKFHRRISRVTKSILSMKSFRIDSTNSILDTAYALDADNLEVIRKEDHSNHANVNSKATTTTTRVVNREKTVIDDYYSTLHQLQKTNRHHLSARSLQQAENEEQRCRTDLLVGDRHNMGTVDYSSMSARSSSPAPASPLSTTSGGGGNKQVTTYTYYTITKDGQKKTVYGGKQQKVVPVDEK